MRIAITQRIFLLVLVSSVLEVIILLNTFIQLTLLMVSIMLVDNLGFRKPLMVKFAPS